jgi:hypothetical protein
MITDVVDRWIISDLFHLGLVSNSRDERKDV